MTIKTKDILKYNSPLDETNYYDPAMLVKKAKGIFIWMEGEGEPYVDLLMGYSSTNFGHVNNDVLKIVKGAVEKFDNVTSFNSKDKIILTKRLIDLLPFPGERLVYYPVGGTKAVDASIKLAMAYTKKKEVVSFNGAFHGYSFAGMAVSDKNFVDKKQYGSSSFPVKFFPFPDKKHITKEESQMLLKNIDRYISKNQARVAAVIIEPIQGAAGFIVPPESFLIGLDKLTKKHKVVFICDEIQIGVCRTGSFYYINQVNIDPDIILLGKSLAGGYYPLSAVIGRKKIFESVNLGSPGFDSTFANNLLGVAIANGVIEFIESKKVNKQVLKTGKRFLSKLREFNKFHFIKDINGVGMAFSYRVESAANSIEENSKLAKAIKRESFKDHLILQTAGVSGDYMKLSPSLLISDEEVDMVLAKLARVMINISKKLELGKL